MCNREQGFHQSVRTIAKKWLFHTDLFEYYVMCSDCFYAAGDQYTGFTGEFCTRDQKNDARLAAMVHFKNTNACERCHTELTASYPGLEHNCPLQEDCSKVPGNTHWYYPGDCKNWEECSQVYAACRNYANDAENGFDDNHDDDMWDE